MLFFLVTLGFSVNSSWLFSTDHPSLPLLCTPSPTAASPPTMFLPKRDYQESPQLCLLVLRSNIHTILFIPPSVAFIPTYFPTSLLQTVLLQLCSHCWLTRFLCYHMRPANPMQICPSLQFILLDTTTTQFILFTCIRVDFLRCPSGPVTHLLTTALFLW